MNNAGSSEADEKTGRGCRYKSMQKSELEAFAVSVIREHRQLLESDQAVYEEWLRASRDPSTSGSVLQTLQDEYIARQKKSLIQLEELSEITNVLGYIPDVPLDGNN
ncbi:transcriptional regulator [Rhizobium sp. NZLR1b]|uniref:transcriptional repressor TraM n=1 Tax=unclassified Rhizobium TaxID=2613769 RepID=UPI001C83AB42|nr:MULTISPECIES: transcriptional repressor TraM [unclassified Rhizobium]MBX5173546.1 transcriptional regulator [Rhizobium sp. NZLR1b]MBX5192660.1 transcriptional regulator [Rhizobium sp. NZLR3b]